MAAKFRPMDTPSTDRDDGRKYSKVPLADKDEKVVESQQAHNECSHENG